MHTDKRCSADVFWPDRAWRQLSLAWLHNVPFSWVVASPPPAHCTNRAAPEGVIKEISTIYRDLRKIAAYLGKGRVVAWPKSDMPTPLLNASLIDTEPGA